SPAVSHTGTIYIGDKDGSLTALDRDGYRLWHLPMGEWGPLDRPAIDLSGNLYTAAMGGKDLYCFTPKAKLLWKVTLPERIVCRPVIGPDKTTLVATASYLYCIE